MENINVTEEDIEWGRANDRWNCVMVRAVQRTHPEATFVRVDKEVVAWTDGTHRYVHDTPAELIDKVIKPLDTGGEVKPCVIVLGEPTVKQQKRITAKDRQVTRSQDRVKTIKQLNSRDHVTVTNNRRKDRYGNES